MKRFFNYLVILLLAAMTAGVVPARADKDTEAEGTDFWFAIPEFKVHKNSDEVSLGASPYNLFITSKVANTVRIYSGDGNLYQTIPVVANKAQVIPLKEIMFTKNEVVGEAKNSFHVESDEPASIIVYVAWKYTGEAYRIIPTDWLGKEYYSFNLYADWTRHLSSSTGIIFNPTTDTYNPPQILIVATEDNTVVSYTPPVETDNVQAYKTGTVTLQKGEIFLIKTKTLATPKVYQILGKYDDLTGTHIVSNKNIAVYSGHTKGGYPGLPLTLYNYSLKTNFLKNMLMEAMWHNDLLGSEYAYVPVDHHGTRPMEVTDKIGYKFDGDLLRFIAVDKGVTRIKKRTGPNTSIDVAVLNQGETFSLEEEKNPCIFYSEGNKRFAVAQYAKNWWWWGPSGIHYKEGENADSKDEELLNPSKNGNGWFYMVTPTSQWCNYAGFYSPSNVDNNYCTIVFKSGAENNIQMFGDGESQGQTLAVKYGADMKTIPGTDIKYINAIVTNGGHYVESMTKKAEDNFALYVYGKNDRAKSGFAYGYPATINYYFTCSDTIKVEETSNCNVINGTITAWDLQTDLTCASVNSVTYNKSTKYLENAAFALTSETGKKTATFKITFKDDKKPGTITITAKTKSGSFVTKTYNYVPDVESIDVTKFDFKKLETGKEACLDGVISNDGQKPLAIKRLFLKDGGKNGVFKITEPVNTANIVIPVGGKIKVTICALVNENGQSDIKDQLNAELECRTDKLADIAVSSGTPRITATDKDFGIVPITGASNKVGPVQMTVANPGTSALYITEIKKAEVNSGDLTHFTDDLPTVSEASPLVIESGSSFTYKLSYDPGAKAANQHVVNVTFVANANTPDPISIWKGQGTDASLTVTGKDWEKRRVIDQWNVDNGVTYYDGVVTLTNSGSSKVDVTKVELADPTMPFVIEQESKDNLIANDIEAGTSVDIKVRFAPKDQMDYATNIKVTGIFAGATKIAENTLQGSGIQPHIATTDVDFGRINLGSSETKVQKDVEFTAITPVAGKEMDLTIKELKFGGLNANKFSIASGFTLPTTPIKAGEKLVVPVVFDPVDPTNAPYTATLTAVCDAPATDINVSNLKGLSFFTSVKTTSYEFPNTYNKQTATGGKVQIENTGSVPIIISKQLDIALVDAVGATTNSAQSFKIERSYLASNTSTTFTPEQNNIVIPAFDKLIVDLKFTPFDVKPFNAKLVYNYKKEDVNSTDIFTDSSDIKGTGIEYLIVAEISKGYHALPGQVLGKDGLAPLTVKLYKDAKESKDISLAKFDDFKVKITFKSSKDIESYHFFPDVKTAKDVILDGTMLEGWNCVGATVNSNTGELLMHFNKPAGVADLSNKNNNTLLKLNVKAYLSAAGVPIPLPVEFIPQGATSDYVRVTNIPGEATIDKVCLDSARLVQFSGKNYSLASVSPNPVANMATIKYTNPIECTVTLEVFDVKGTKIATVVNERKTPGEYEANIDVNALGLTSGTYSYRIQMGPYSETKTMVIEK
jgi:hypothetical protein